MKRTGLLCLGLLLIASSLFAQGIPMTGVQNGTGAVGGGPSAVAYCTAATTCTATYPDVCSLLCEDMEGTNPCWLTGPSYCRQAANAWTVALGGSSAITVAAPNAALCANTTNTHGAFNIAVATTSAQDAYIAYTFGSAQTDLNIQFYLTVTSSSLGDGIYGQIFAHDSAGPTLFNTLYLVNVGGTPKLSLWYQVTNPEDTQLGTAQTITLGTPYRININWNEAGTISWSIDGNPIATAYDGSTSFLVTDLVFGAQAMDYAGSPGITYTYQIDNIAIDPTGTPGACQ